MQTAHRKYISLSRTRQSNHLQGNQSSNQRGLRHYLSALEIPEQSIIYPRTYVFREDFLKSRIHFGKNAKSILKFRDFEDGGSPY